MWNDKYKNRFLPTGRIGRKDFAKNILFVWITGLILIGAMNWTMENFPFIAILAMLYFVVLCWVQLCLYAKRMHDFGFRVWWLLLPSLLGGLFAGKIVLHASFGFNFMQPNISTFLTLAVLVALFAVPGQKTANKFGEPV